MELAYIMYLKNKMEKQAGGQNPQGMPEGMLTFLKTKAIMTYVWCSVSIQEHAQNTQLHLHKYSAR